MEKNYLNEEKGLTPQLAMEEAARCLLCEDAPCSKGCPAKTNPAKFIRSLRFRNVLGAVETIRSENPLGGICARVCPTEKYCELECSRSGIDRPINIGKLQRFITDYESASGYKVYEKIEKKNGRIAVIGSGPSGIAASNVLARAGYEVTIFEQNSKAGGYLSYGIPSYRLPQEVVDREIQYTLDLGVKLLTNKTLGKDISINSLVVEGFLAIIIAVGYSEASELEMFKNNPYVESATTFLARTKTSRGDITLGNSLLVVGGGDVAMDVATSAKRLGVKAVTVVARETLDIFPASEKERNSTFAENVSIIDGYTPLSVDTNTVSFKSMEGENVLKVKADKIILAIGQRPAILEEIEYGRGTAKVKPEFKSVFVTGDLVEGDKTVVAAIKKGKECANQVIAYLGGKK